MFFVLSISDIPFILDSEAKIISTYDKGNYSSSLSGEEERILMELKGGKWKTTASKIEYFGTSCYLIEISNKFGKTHELFLCPTSKNED